MGGNDTNPSRITLSTWYGGFPYHCDPKIFLDSNFVDTMINAQGAKKNKQMEGGNQRSRQEGNSGTLSRAKGIRCIRCKIIDGCRSMFRADRRRRLGDQMLPEPEVTETWYPKSTMEARCHGLITRSILEHACCSTTGLIRKQDSTWQPVYKDQHSRCWIICRPEAIFCTVSWWHSWSAGLDQGEQAEYFLMELRMRRRHRDKSLQQLGQAIRDLTGLGYPERSATARERLAKTHFSEAKAHTNEGKPMCQKIFPGASFQLIWEKRWTS